MRGGPHAEIVNEVVLRTQMQAIYDTDNIGHFGLNLDRYAHFTSPIRRYADLIVHRGLIRALGLGDDGLTDQDDRSADARPPSTITMAERRGDGRRARRDRPLRRRLPGRARQGADFAGRITGVTRFGLFVRLAETGADGLVPVSSLGDEYFIHDERAHALVGERTGAAGGWARGRGAAARGDADHRRAAVRDAERAGAPRPQGAAAPARPDGGAGAARSAFPARLRAAIVSRHGSTDRPTRA